MDLKSGRTYPARQRCKTLFAHRVDARRQWHRGAQGESGPSACRERANVLLAWPNVRDAFANAEVVPVGTRSLEGRRMEKEWVLSERAPLSWSLDKSRVFFGAKAQVVPQDTGRKPSADSVADVDVWRTTDTRIQSAQMIRAPQELELLLIRQAFDFEMQGSSFCSPGLRRCAELDVSPDGRSGCRPRSAIVCLRLEAAAIRFLSCEYGDG